MAGVLAPQASVGLTPIGTLGETFRGVNPIADACDSRNTDAPDALQYALQNAPPGSTVTGNVWWDTYRDPVTNVVLLDNVTGTAPASPTP